MPEKITFYVSLHRFIYAGKMIHLKETFWERILQNWPLNGFLSYKYDKSQCKEHSSIVTTVKVTTKLKINKMASKVSELW